MDSQSKNWIYSDYRTFSPGKKIPRGVLAYYRKFSKVYIPEDRSSVILDLGCGQGPLLFVLQELGYANLRGIDISISQVASAYSAFVHQGDLFEALRCTEERSVDCLVTLDLIEHLDIDELRLLAMEARRVLKKTGRWVIRVPNAEGIHGASLRYADLTHERCFTTSSMRQLANCAELRVEVLACDIFPVYGLISGFRFVAWQLISRLLWFARAAETGEYRSLVLSRNLLAVFRILR